MQEVTSNSHFRSPLSRPLYVSVSSRTEPRSSVSPKGSDHAYIQRYSSSKKEFCGVGSYWPWDDTYVLAFCWAVLDTSTLRIFPSGSLCTSFSRAIFRYDKVEIVREFQRVWNKIKDSPWTSLGEISSTSLSPSTLTYNVSWCSSCNFLLLARSTWHEGLFSCAFHAGLTAVTLPLSLDVFEGVAMWREFKSRVEFIIIHLDLPQNPLPQQRLLAQQD